MVFKRAVQRYGRTPEPETPYQRAGQVWDERIGSARVQARNWRMMAFGCLTLASCLSSGLVWQSLQSKVTPYVVEVDALGAARAVSEAGLAQKPSDAQTSWALSRFIMDVRGVSLDPVLMRRSWLEAYDFATRRGADFISEHARRSGALSQASDRTVSVQVTSVVRASDRSFQVKWAESVYERGRIAGTTRWTAMLGIVEKPPHDAETLRKNPFGVYVDAIDWSRELEVPVPQSSPPAPTLPAATASEAGLAGMPVPQINPSNTKQEIEE